MFVEAELTLLSPLEVVKEALSRAIDDGGLVAQSRRALEEGLVFIMPVGPRGSHRPSRDVVVRLLPMRQIGERYVLPLRWEVPGSSSRLFPALDADLELCAEGPDCCRLSVMGRYEPPLGKVGSGLDRAGLSRLALATMASLLREIRAQLEQQARALHPVDPPGGNA
jgi:hypothetical protein